MALDYETVEETRQAMLKKLAGIVPDFEIAAKAELVFKINQLKRKRGAIIFGHNYMEPALYHTVADIVGDSLQLAREAAVTDCDPIVFCGVRFMAETAKILNPKKKVLLPAKKAGCSLASSISAADVKRLRARFPGAPVVAYVNTYADLKAEVDVCCTSSNARSVIEGIGSERVIFIPDEYLSRNVAREAGKSIFVVGATDDLNTVDVGDAEIIAWRGACEVHEQFSAADVKNARAQFPDALILAHPECKPEVVEQVDFAASTSAMVNFVKQSDKKRFMLFTECSMGDNIIAENPGKETIRMCSIRCPHMNEITLEDTLRALETDEQEITVPEAIQQRAKRSLERMLDFV